jgi:hypothetical protein
MIVFTCNAIPMNSLGTQIDAARTHVPQPAGLGETEKV